jgi:hypothetical protein
VWAADKKELPNNDWAKAIKYLEARKGLGAGKDTIDIFGVHVPSEITLIGNLEVGISSRIRAYVVAKTRTNSYIGCGKCMSKLDSEGICPKCEKEVEPTEYIFENWALADDSNVAVIASFPPKIVGPGLDIEGKTMQLVGIVEVATLKGGMETKTFNVKKVLEDKDIIASASSSPAPSSSEKASLEVGIKAADASGDKVDVNIALTEEAGRLKTTLHAFGDTSLDKLVNWHKVNKLKYSLDSIIEAAGAKVVTGPDLKQMVTLGEEPEIPKMDFDKAVFNIGENLTVRLGTKWAGLKEGDKVRIGDGIATILGVTAKKFKEIATKELEREHDPKCKTVAGLKFALKRSYGDKFSEDSDVVLVRFQFEG